LLEAASQLLAINTYDELLTQSVSCTVAALPMVQAGMLWLYDQRSQRLQLVAHHGASLEPSILPALSDCQLGTDEGMIGRAFEGSDTVMIEPGIVYTSFLEHLTARPRKEWRDMLRHLRDHLSRSVSFICLPLRTNEETIGVLVLIDFEQALDPVLPQQLRNQTAAPEMRHLFNQLLPTFSRLIATVIHNKQLYDQSQDHRQRLDAFDAVVTAISTATDLPDMLRSVLHVLLGFLPVSSGAIFVLDPIQSRLKLGAYTNLPDDYVATIDSFPIENSPFEEVANYGQPVLRPLIDARGEALLIESGLQSCAYLPLLAGGTVVGTLGLYGSATLHRELDMTRLMPLSNQIGFAIANVRLYEDSYLERHKLNTVINSIAEGVVLCDSQGRLVLANETAMALLSLEAVPFEQHVSEMVDFYSIRDMDNNPLPIEQLPMARALAGETFQDHRVKLHGVSGDNSVMSFSGAPIRAGAQNIEGAVVVFRDITARERRERAKDDFLAVAAHELRNPLAAVRSYADLLLRREQQRTESNDSRDLHGLHVLSQQVTHMLRMVDNLLDVSRLDAGQVDLQSECIDLVSLAEQVLDQQRPVAADHELILDTEHNEIWLACDALRVRQILTNLVSNAVKYSPAGKSVHVHIGVRRVECETAVGGDIADTDYPAEEGHAPAYEALIRVSDQGRGIAHDQQTRLFQRFYRAKRPGADGLGLGLYLSREFVEMHGGQIRVESTEGQGSTFLVTLPIHAEPHSTA
jgi:two-component system phosphate regulon sensor histidine kinase PhoR